MALDRRPLKTRDRAWPRALATALARRGMTANGMSVSGVVAAAGAAVAISATLWVEAPWARSALWLAAALGIQLRLVANLLDGLIAIEGGRRSPVGDIYNDVPDRLEDALAIVPAGYALTALWPYGDDLGWAAIALAITT
ncbi:MAG TPA: CDP-alcohol phosphatidyltransferase family protein, partial [Planctomycetota bacterium]|nr:CDP-alcohol phosphatidyltransferase family protein [Planctomycetota bacterium]